MERLNAPDKARAGSGVLSTDDVNVEVDVKHVSSLASIREVWGEINAVLSEDLVWNKACRDRLCVVKNDAGSVSVSKSANA